MSLNWSKITYTHGSLQTRLRRDNTKRYNSNGRGVQVRSTCRILFTLITSPSTVFLLRELARFKFFSKGICLPYSKFEFFKEFKLVLHIQSWRAPEKTSGGKYSFFNPNLIFPFRLALRPTPTIPQLFNENKTKFSFALQWDGRNWWRPMLGCSFVHALQQRIFAHINIW